MNGKIIEISLKYHEICPVQGDPCRILFDVTEKMEQPVYLFYEIDNFYQNHRRYLKSKSLTQLSGTNIDLAAAEKNCDPIIRVRDLNVKVSWGTKKPLNNDDIANPCGLIAKSFFNGKIKISWKFKLAIIDIKILTFLLYFKCKENGEKKLFSFCNKLVKFIFLDTYKLLDAVNKEIKINEKGITWSDDVGNKFKRTKDSQNEQWIDPEDGINKIYFK